MWHLWTMVVAMCALTMTHDAIAKPKHNRVIAVKLFSIDDGGSEVFVRTDRKPDYTARVAQGGKRLILDIRGAVLGGADPAITNATGVVGGVMTQTFKDGAFRTTRLLIQLLETSEYRVRANKTGLRVILHPAEKTQAAGAKVVATKKGATKKAKQRPTATVEDIRFVHSEDGDRIVIELSGPAAFNDQARSSKRSVLVIRGAALPKKLQRKLNTAAYKGHVTAVSTYPTKDGSVLVDVDHDPTAAGTPLKVGNSIHYWFGTGTPPATLSGVGPDGRAARKVKHLSSEPALAPVDAALNTATTVSDEDDEWSSDPDVAGAFIPGTTPGQVRRYTGRRVDLDLKDADIHNVLRILAEAGRVNIVAADNVTGAVTIRLKNVPWDQALDTILQAKKLGMVRRGNIIRVALMADLNKERELAIARRKSELQLAPIQTRLIPISYATAGDMAAKAQDLLSPRGSVTVDERTNVLIVRDVGGNLNQIEELTRALDTQTPQVLIEARIVEATSRFQRDVGIQWGGDVTFGPATGNATGLVFPSSIGVVGGASDQGTPTAGLSPTEPTVSNPNFVVNLPATVGTGQGGALGLTFGSIDNTVNLNVRLSAAELTGMLRIVSSPRILTLDNHEARINQGTLIPFSQVSAQGVQTVFQEAKLQLLVIPHVTADGSVSMHVKINRDEPDFNQTSARGDPTILKREAETDLLVRDGHTAVIGGIYTRNTGRNIDMVPLLGDIPVLGVLFSRRRQSDTRGELVIFLTPRIVNRAESLGR